MTNDFYLRAVLTVIAAALVYLCVVLTPLPTVSAQAGRVVGAPVPGVSTGPAEMVVVGWRAPESLPVTVTRGEVRVTNDVLPVSGTVRTEQPPNAMTRTVLVGWEELASTKGPGSFNTIGDVKSNGLPVTVRGQR